MKKEKKELRELMLSTRKSMDLKYKSKYDAKICNSLKNQILNNTNLNVVHCYLPIKSEIDVTPFLAWCLKQGIKVVCPRVIGPGLLDSVQLSDLGDITIGPSRTIHPGSEITYNEDIDLIIVPGLAFDMDRNRLGYGGGYYDRFLKKKRYLQSLAILYPFQFIDSVPIETHDVKIDDLLVFDDV